MDQHNGELYLRAHCATERKPYAAAPDNPSRAEDEKQNSSNKQLGVPIWRGARNGFVRVPKTCLDQKSVQGFRSCNNSTPKVLLLLLMSAVSWIPGNQPKIH
jgi:hypothetical protein